jgi:hypothetical protein
MAPKWCVIIILEPLLYVGIKRLWSMRKHET